MKSALAYLTLALLTFPWWWRLLRLLVADVAAAGAPQPLEGQRAGSRRERPGLAPSLVGGSRARANRLQAFQGLPRRVAARRRWEGGFGRRSL